MQAKEKSMAQKKMSLRKTITMTVRIPPRGTQPLSSDERKQLADFFAAVMDLRPKENEMMHKEY